MNKKEIEKILKDYHWMINEIKRQRELMKITGGNLSPKLDGLPIGKGTPSDPVAREVIRRDEASKWVQKLEEKVLFVQERMKYITNERERAVLECLLDGLSILAISKHMGLSERHVRRLKDSIVTKMSEMPNLPKMPKTTKKTNSCA